MEASRDQLPEPQTLLAETDWASIWHAYGPAGDTPSELAMLLDEDPDRVDEAIRHLHYTVSHQNSVYPATVPVALYVAGILADPRSAVASSRFERIEARSVRTLLMDWLSGMASDIGDECVRIMERLGFALDEYLEMKELRAWRPAIVQAVSAFLDDPDPDVRHAAVRAAVLLLDSPDAVERHGLIPYVREMLATSTDPYHHNCAIDALNADAERTGSALIPAVEYWRPQPPPGAQTLFTAWDESPPF